MQEQRRGYKTTEFVVTILFTLASIILASGLVSEQSTWGQILALVAGALATSSYNLSRGAVKSKEELRKAVETQAGVTAPPTERRSSTQSPALSTQ